MSIAENRAHPAGSERREGGPLASLSHIGSVPLRSAGFEPTTTRLDPQDVIKTGPAEARTDGRHRSRKRYGLLQPGLRVVGAPEIRMSLVHLPTGIQVSGGLGANGDGNGEFVRNSSSLETLLWQKLEAEVAAWKARRIK